jgi:acyl-CoA synthetase (AMP-forming)/AMP-acid ligase II
MTTQPLPVYPPLDGTVLLPDLPDFNLQHNPTLPAFVYSLAPNSNTQISFLEFARACHRVAHAVRPNRAGPEGEIVGLIANTDTILYLALVAGMVRAGVVVSINIYVSRSRLIRVSFRSRSRFRPAILPRPLYQCSRRSRAIASS